MRSDERSRDVFEEVPGYEKPPLPSLSAADDFASLARKGFIRLTPTSRRILAAAFRAVRYQAFHDTLPARLEDMLRRTNMRDRRLFAPVFSATAALADDPRPLGALERAATLVAAARSLCHDVMSGRLAPDTYQGQALEMGQYPNLFSNIAYVEGRARIFKGKRFDRVGILVRRRAFVLELSADGEHSVPAIAKALAAAVAAAEDAPAVRDDDAPGVLSAATTRTLTSALREMESSEPDRSSLAALRDCFLVLCLDLDLHPSSAAEAARLAHAANPANRWYLASFQLVVFGNARATALFSLVAYLDGNVMVRSAAEVWQRAAREPLIATTQSPPLRRPTLLHWSTSHFARRAWKEVRRVQDDQIATFVINGVGRQKFVACGLDPVGAFVVALALATKRRQQSIPAISQLLTISRYRCVPVGSAIVTTAELRELLEHIDGGGDPSKTPCLLAAAIASHSRECRKERSHLTLRWPIDAFISSRRGVDKVFTVGVLGAALIALKITGNLGTKDVVVSHPQIFPEVPMVGRPGVRLPYVNHFGVHYQIFERETVVTFMPGLKWRTPNAAFIRDVERAIDDILAIGQSGRSTTADS